MCRLCSCYDIGTMTIPEKKSEATICPFMGKPFANCYCVRTESIYISKVLSLCGRNYECCDIYRDSDKAGLPKKDKK